MRNHLIPYQPFDFELKSVITSRSTRREAVAREDVRRFLEWIKQDKHYGRYYDGMYVLFHTGLRMSEFYVLIPSDIDFDCHCITVSRQLRKKNTLVHIEDVKTKAGARVVPMNDEVEACLRHAIETRPCPRLSSSSPSVTAQTP